MRETNHIKISKKDISLIKTNVIPKNIAYILSMIGNKEIVSFYPHEKDTWDIVKNSRFIESLILQLPIPSFYFNELPDGKWSIMDGLQRLCALDSYFHGTNIISNNNGKFKLAGLEFLKEDYEGKSWDELDRPTRRRILYTPITINLIGKETPDNIKYIIFQNLDKYNHTK